MAFKTIYSIFSGAVIGFLICLFSTGIDTVIKIREYFGFWMILGLPIAGLVIVYLYESLGKNANLGVGVLFRKERNQIETLPEFLAPLTWLSAMLSHLFGACTGRTGAAIQIGASIGDLLERKLSFFRSLTYDITPYIAASFSGLFGLPLAGAFFSLEIFDIKTKNLNNLFLVFLSSFSAYGIRYLLGMETFLLPFEFESHFQLSLIFLSILSGLAGGLFAFLFQLCKEGFKKFFSSPYARVLIGSLFLVVCYVLIGNERYFNTGQNLINEQMFLSHDWILKAALTILCAASGFVGGEVMPIFTVGAAFGSVVSSILGIDPSFGAALGVVAFFASSTHTFMTPLILGIEWFGFSFLPCSFLVVLLSYLLNGKQSIYQNVNKQERSSIIVKVLNKWYNK